MLRSWMARVALAGLYGAAWTGALLGRCLPHGPWRPTGRILVTGTFHNPNWYFSHIRPLARSGLREVVLVVDEPQQPIERVRFVCPPRWLARLIGRAGAKAIWLIGAGLRYRADLYMGYTVLPGACSALVAARLMGRPACYQMTGGPVEIEGGGVQKEGPVTRSLGRSSPLLERLAVAVVRQFDLVVVRGGRARQFLYERHLNGSVAIITGSIAPPAPANGLARDIDLIYVGRLAGVKQPWQVLEVVSAVRRQKPDVRAVIVGDGPLLAELHEQARQMELQDNVEFLGQRGDVEALLARSKVFLLTSRSEGLSIAMAEAMAAGAVPVVADVGELATLVWPGRTGYLIRPNHISEYAEHVLELLDDAGAWARCSAAARQLAVESCGLQAVARRWQSHLTDVIDRSARPRTRPRRGQPARARAPAWATGAVEPPAVPDRPVSV